MAVQLALEDTRQKVLHDDWRWNWEHRVENAKARPTMFIGDLEAAHQNAVRDALALVRTARAFRAPKLSEIHLSPNKYAIRSEAGRLLPAIESLHTWSGKHLLQEGWEQVHEHLSQQRFDKLFDEGRDFVGWRKYFAGPTGPTLDRPLRPAALARRFAFAYKTSLGFWGQTFEGGKSPDAPFLLTQPSDVGLLIMAELDPRWFIGLPFTPDDVQRLAEMPDVSAVWHSEDNELDIAVKSESDIRRWL